MIKSMILKHKKIVAVISIIALLAAGIGLSKAGSSESEAATEIKEQEAAIGDVANTISATGSLEEDSSVNVKLPEGIVVTDVLVSEGDKVKKSDVLAKVDRTSVAEVILELEESEDELEDAIASLSTPNDTTSTDYLKKIVYDGKLDDIASAKTKLKELLSSSAVKADKNGTVTSIDVSEGEEVTSKTESGSVSMEGTSYSSGDTVITLLSSGVNTGDAGATVTASETSGGAGTQEVTKDDESITNDDLVTLSVVQPETGEKPQDRVASTSKYDAAITWNAGSEFKSGKSYTATIVLTSKNGYAFTYASCYDIAIDGATLISGTPKVTGGTESGNSLVIKARFENTEAESGSAAGAKEDSGKASESSVRSSGKNSTKADSSAAASGSFGSASGSSGSGAASGSAQSGSDASSTSDSSASADAGVNMVTCFTMSKDSKMSVTVSVDETDINSVKAGQTASVTLDAIEGETFDGKITKVSASSQNSSGSSGSGSSSGSVKYEATVEIDKASGMKAGMTAQVTINVEEATDVITIPSAALNEENGTTYVYTKKDGDELSGKTEVKTGLSSGSTVEITSGLEEGTKVYYEVRTSENGNAGRQGKNGGMPGMNGNGENQGPPSGEMPQGGPGGNK